MNLGEDFETRLGHRLRGARRVAVVGIGDELQPHDRLGILAAREVEGLRLGHTRIFIGGTVPETLTGPLRRYGPDRVLFLDAVQMDTRPGTVAIVEANQVRGSRLSTHAMPLSILMEYVEKTTGARVTLVGLQPDLRAGGESPTSAEQAGLTRFVASFQHILSRSRSGVRPGKRTLRARTYRRYRTGEATK